MARSSSSSSRDENGFISGVAGSGMGCWVDAGEEVVFAIIIVNCGPKWDGIEEVEDGRR